MQLGRALAKAGYVQRQRGLRGCCKLQKGNGGVICARPHSWRETQTQSWDEDASAKGPISRNSRDAFSVLFISMETIMETRGTETRK